MWLSTEDMYIRNRWRHRWRRGSKSSITSSPYNVSIRMEYSASCGYLFFLFIISINGFDELSRETIVITFSPFIVKPWFSVIFEFHTFSRDNQTRNSFFGDYCVTVPSMIEPSVWITILWFYICIYIFIHQYYMPYNSTDSPGLAYFSPNHATYSRIVLNFFLFLLHLFPHLLFYSFNTHTHITSNHVLIFSILVIIIVVSVVAL